MIEKTGASCFSRYSGFLDHNFRRTSAGFILGDDDLPVDPLAQLGDVGNDADQPVALRNPSQRVDRQPQGFFVE